MIRWLPRNLIGGLGECTPEALADLIRAAEQGAGTGACPSETIEAIVAGLDPLQVQASLETPPEGEDLCAAIPPRLWEHLLASARVTRERSERRWLPTPAARELAPQGASRGSWEEWWGWPEPALAGARYGDDLWAWGVTRGPEEGTGELASFTPRDAWLARDGTWQLHPVLKDWVDREPRRPRPLVERGPGFLAASLVRGMQDLVNGKGPLGARDRAALWAAFLLPLVALSRSRPSGPSGALDLQPDFVYALPFHALHTRTQALVLAVERLCTCLIVGDVWTLRRAFQALGRPAAGPDRVVLKTAAQRVRALAGRLLGQGAGERYDSGFGFRLAREICREAGLGVEGSADEAVARAWDGVVHRDEGDNDGHTRDLGGRLNSAFAAALATVREGQDVAPARALLALTVQHWSDDAW